MLKETRAALTQRQSNHEFYNGRANHRVMTLSQFGVRHKPHTMSAAVRAAGGSKWGTGPQPIREAVANEDYNIPGIEVAVIEEFWETPSSLGFIAKMMERDLREAFFDRSDRSIGIQLRLANNLIRANSERFKCENLKGTASERAIDLAAHWSLQGMTQLYTGRSSASNVAGQHFVDAIESWRECYRVSVKAGGNTVSLHHDNYALAVAASTAASNLIYGEARAYGINHALVKAEACKIVTQARLLSAYHMADLLLDPRISNNHAEMALLADQRDDAINLMKLTIRLAPGAGIKEGIWDRPKWLFADDPEMEGFKDLVDDALRDYLAENPQK
jgi:hypothetical protein